MQGALVQILFTMSHYTIAGRRGKPPIDTFVANIAGIRTLDTITLPLDTTMIPKRVAPDNPFDDDDDDKAESSNRSNTKKPRYS